MALDWIRKHPYTSTWIGLGAIGVAVEVGALISEHDDQHAVHSLSRNLQWLFDRPKLRVAALIGWLGFAAWFADHLFGESFGWFRDPERREGSQVARDLRLHGGSVLDVR